MTTLSYDRVGWGFRETDLSPEVPEGLKGFMMESDYYGSHQERGETNEPVFIALPIGQKLPEGFRLSHGRDRSWGWVFELPAEALLASCGDKEWQTRDAFIEDYGLEKEMVP